MLTLKNTLIIIWVVAIIICSETECRRVGGGTSRGYSRPSSPSRPSSSSSGNRDSSHSGSSGSSSYGWQRPSSNTNSHPSPPQSSYGWQRPGTNTHTNTNPRPDTSGGSSYGWKKPDTNSHPTSGTNYGWKRPDSTNTHTQPGTPAGGGWKKPDSTNTQTHTQQANPGGGAWKKPDTNTNHGSPTNPQSPSYGWKKPDTNAPHQTSNIPRKDTQTNVGHSYPPRPGSVGTGTGYKHSDAPSANIGPKGYPVQPGHKYNTGYNHGYQQGYANGYHTGYHQTPAAQPSNYGFSHNYYPQNNHFGYPGQGMYSGPGGPTYGGMHVFGSNGHYGYPTNSMWGYPSYGSGGSGSTLKGVLIGAVAGYYVNSLLHRATSPNHWGYTGSGYGSQYSHVTIDKRTFINNHYNNQTTENGKDNSTPNNWIQCVAFDPTTQSTLINPNCSCTVSVITDPATNVSSSVHNCSTTYGYQTEKIPTGRYAPDIETFDVRYATPQAGTPEKFVNGSDANSVLDKAEQKKREFLLQLEKMVNMGSFVS